MSANTRTITVSWRTAPITVTTYKYRTYTPAFAAALAELERLCAAEGIYFRITQGGFNSTVNASAGTHNGDAVDISVSGLSKEEVTRIITIGRMLGMSMWFRTTSVAKWGTRAQGFSSYHIHAVPNKWGVAHPSAVNQADDYRRGRDGLASSQADLGPGHVGNYRTRTWQEYLTLRPSVPSATLPPLPTAQPSETGGLNMASAEYTAIMKAIEEVKAQNRAIHTDVAGGDVLRARRLEDTLAIWNFPIHRSSGSTAVISEIAQHTSMLTSLSSLVAAIAKDSGVDEAQIVKGVTEGILPAMRQAIIASQGDVDQDQAEAFAEAVFERFRKSMNAPLS